MLRPRLLTNLLDGCVSIRAKRLFLFFADRHDHGWSKHIDRQHIDLGRGKRQLVTGGRLAAPYQITVPATFPATAGETAQCLRTRFPHSSPRWSAPSPKLATPPRRESPCPPLHHPPAPAPSPHTPPPPPPPHPHPP